MTRKSEGNIPSKYHIVCFVIKLFVKYIKHSITRETTTIFCCTRFESTSRLSLRSNIIRNKTFYSLLAKPLMLKTKESNKDPKLNNAPRRAKILQQSSENVVPRSDKVTDIGDTLYLNAISGLTFVTDLVISMYFDETEY